MTIDDSDTICSLCDKLKDTPYKNIGEKIRELSTYDEFLIGDCLTYLAIKEGTEKFWTWQEFNGNKNAGIRNYDNVVIKNRNNCGVLV